MDPRILLEVVTPRDFERPLTLLICMITLKKFLILSCVVGLVSCQEKSFLPQDELELYDQALDQIVAEYAIGGCLSRSDREVAEKVSDAFRKEKIDEGECRRIGDSIVAVRKSQLPKCVMEYSSSFVRWMPKSDYLASMTYVLRDDFIREHFGMIDTAKVIDTLLENTSRWNDITLPYMNFVAHDTKDRKYYYGKTAVGVIALSKIYVAPDKDHALLYFEFRTQPNFECGEIVFLEKNWGTWKIVASRNVWIT